MKYNGILFLGVAALGVLYMVSKARKAAAQPPDVTSLAPEIGKNVLDAWRIGQAQKSQQSYDPASGRVVDRCPSGSRVWNPTTQRWECMPVAAGKNEEQEVRF